MFEFYSNVPPNKFNTFLSMKCFAVGEMGYYQKILLKHLNISKCDRYDKLLISKFESNPYLLEIVSKKHFTYKLLDFLIGSLKCDIDTSGKCLYYVNIPLNNPFGSVASLDMIFRIIEFGDFGKIKPYNLFSNCLIDSKKHSEKMLSLRFGGNR